MNYDRLTCFIKAAKLQNFSEAARQMYITPQAFGRQISRFEEEIGIALFNRTKNKVTLTYEGEIVYQHIKPLMTALEHEYAAMKRMALNRKGKLTVGILSFLNRPNVISPLMTEIYSQTSIIDVNTHMYEMAEFITAAHTGEIDLGISLINEGMAYFEDYDIICLKTVPAKVVVSLYNKCVIKDTLTEDDLKKMNRIRFNIKSAADNAYTQYPCKEEILVENYATLLAYLNQDEGYAIVSPDMGDAGMEYQTKFLDLPGPPLLFDLALLCRKGEKRQNVLKLITKIKELFE